MVQYYGNVPQTTSTPVVPTPTPTSPNQNIKYGDVNNDNAVNSIDFGLLRQTLLGMPTSVSVNMSAADLNVDGKVNSIDFAILRGYLLGIYRSLPQQL